MASKIIRKTFSLLLCLALTVALAIPCFAQDNEHVIASYTEDLGNNITVVVTITQTVTRSTTTTTKAHDYYYDGQYIGRAALSASFYYDGSTSRATEAIGTGSGANGWSYGGQSTGTSGNRAYLNRDPFQRQPQRSRQPFADLQPQRQHLLTHFPPSYKTRRAGS